MQLLHPPQARVKDFTAQLLVTVEELVSNLQDDEAVLDYLVLRGETEQALAILRRPGVSQELVYKFSPSLMAQAPHATVRLSPFPLLQDTSNMQISQTDCANGPSQHLRSQG